MQINNILDFDDEASAKTYNFTITPLKSFMIQSNQTSLQRPAEIPFMRI